MSDISLNIRKQNQISFRHNKLTQLMRDGLGFNSQTFFIFCINHLSKYAEDTAITIKSALHSKNIKTNPFPIKF